jgi:hypothetical protein
MSLGDKPISLLPVLPGDNFEDNDEFPIRRNDTTFKSIILRLKKYLKLSGTGGTPNQYHGANELGEYGLWNLPDASSAPFDGNRAITRVPTVGLNVGTTTNLNDWVEAVFFPFVAAAIGINAGGTFEVGSTPAITVAGTITLNDEPALGITNRRVLRNGAPWQTFASNSYSFPTTITRNTPGTITHQALMNVTNTGNGAPGSVASGIRTDTFKYYRFWGSSTAAEGVPTNSAQVRALGNSSSGNTFSIIIPAGDTNIMFAYEASRPDINANSVIYQEAFNAAVGLTFNLINLTVNDAGGNPVAYKLWVSQLGAPYPDAATYNVTIP